MKDISINDASSPSTCKSNYNKEIKQRYELVISANFFLILTTKYREDVYSFLHR